MMINSNMIYPYVSINCRFVDESEHEIGFCWGECV